MLGMCTKAQREAGVDTMHSFNLGRTVCTDLLLHLFANFLCPCALHWGSGPDLLPSNGFICPSETGHGRSAGMGLYLAIQSRAGVPLSPKQRIPPTHHLIPTLSQSTKKGTRNALHWTPAVVTGGQTTHMERPAWTCIPPFFPCLCFTLI